MAKWIFAVFEFVLVFVVLGASAEAHEPQPESREDGCAALEQIIYEEVTAASWGVTVAETTLRKFDAPGVVVCVDTTLVASRAFSTAMRAVGQAVSWNIPIDPGMEACLGGDIEQCITTPSPWLPAAQLEDTWQVPGVWDAVSRAVRQAMPYGSASNRSVFSRDVLRHAVRSAVRGRHLESRIRRLFR